MIFVHLLQGILIRHFNVCGLHLYYTLFPGLAGLCIKIDLYIGYFGLDAQDLVLQKNSKQLGVLL